MDYPNQIGGGVAAGVAYGQNALMLKQSGQVVSDASMGNQFDSHLKRLSEVEMRLNQIADVLYGPTPQGAHPDKTGPRPIVSMASRVRDFGDAVASIENVVNRLQGQL